MALTNTNVVSLLGELFQVGERPNAFLRLLGAFQAERFGGIMKTNAREFPIGTYMSLDAPSQPAVLEGAAAPAPTTQTISGSSNVIQIYQETVGVTYLGASDKTVSGIVAIPTANAQGDPVNPRSMDFQLMAKLAKIARDINYTSIRGVYANPADATTTALKSRGIMTAIATNIVDQTATVANTITAQVYRQYIDVLMQAVCAANGYNPDNYWVVMCDAGQYVNIQRAYYGQTQAPQSRTVAGMQLREILTPFGTITLVLEPDMPANTVGVFNLANVGLVGMEVEGKGILFNEPLAKTGSSDSEQIYGQLGLDHGPEWQHGKLLLPAGVVIPG